MTPVARSRATVLGLALFALWPLLQHGLARSFQVNPWKLGGFAMYTTPAPPLEIGWIVVGPRGPARLEPGSLPMALRSALRDFEQRRHALGRLASPEPLARRLLDALPQHQALVVVIRRYQMEARTARFRMAEERVVIAR